MPVKLTRDERQIVVNSLIESGVCCWEESDRKVLNGLNDRTLAKLHRQMEITANAEDAEGASKDQLDEDDDKDVAAEDEATKKGNSQADGKDKPFGDENPKAGEGPANNQLSVQDRRDLAFARRYRMAQRKSYMDAITANANNRFSPKHLAAMSDEVLANMAELAGRDEPEPMFSQPNYFGSQGAAVINTSMEEDDPLPIANINYQELAKGNGRA